ncbi:MAG: hypothetical protein ACJAUV_000813 [Flavobacteriales bacterium]|jgi:hypothetical protein
MDVDYLSHKKTKLADIDMDVLQNMIEASIKQLAPQRVRN